MAVRVRGIRVAMIAATAAASLIITVNQPASGRDGTERRPEQTPVAFSSVPARTRAATLARLGRPAETPPGGHAVPLEAGTAASTIGVLVVDGGKHGCSAAVVASDSRRLLSTAAHCVWLSGRWTLDGAYFVPGYRDGEEPWGRWTVEAAWVPRSWQEANSPIHDVASAHDVAFVRLAPSSSGRLAEDVLGSQGIWFDAPATPTVTAVGYPSVGVFDGSQPERCTGAAHVEQTPDQRTGTGESATRLGGEVLVMDCDMTQGSSGGPWLVGPRAETGWGQVIGVVSGGSGPELTSARFGPEAEQVYDAADVGSVPAEDGPQ